MDHRSNGTRWSLLWWCKVNNWMTRASMTLSHARQAFLLKPIDLRLRIICMHSELTPKISTNDSITSLQASKIMSCDITVSPSENSLPSPESQLDSSDYDCTAAHSTLIFPRAEFHKRKWFPPPRRRQLVLYIFRVGSAMTVVWRERKSQCCILTFSIILIVVMETEKPTVLSDPRGSWWQNKLYEEKHQSSSELNANTGQK